MAELQRFNMDKNMKKLTKEELNQRASNKAFSKIFHLEEDFKQAKKDVRTGGDGRFSTELLEVCRDSTDRELQTWNYIAQLIELDNTEGTTNVKALKDLISLNTYNEK